jgi:hypothetical protein
MVAASSERPAPAHGSYVGFWVVPLECLAGDGGDALEVVVVVAVQERQSLRLGRAGHHETDDSGAVVLSALGEEVLDLPAWS